MRNVWIAVDGKEFYSERDCHEYEYKLKETGNYKGKTCSLCNGTGKHYFQKANLLRATTGLRTSDGYLIAQSKRDDFPDSRIESDYPCSRCAGTGVEP